MNRCVGRICLRMIVLGSIGTFGASPTAEGNGCIGLRERVSPELRVGILLELSIEGFLELHVVNKGRLGCGRGGCFL